MWVAVLPPQLPPARTAGTPRKDDMRLIRNNDKVRLTKVRDKDGRTAGFRVEHKDGRVDAVARPPTVHYGKKR